MQKKLLKLVTILFVLTLSGCSIFSDKKDDDKDWAAAKLYSEARDELSNGAYERSIQLFQRLEARYPFGVYAQQAQMEIAYVYYRKGEPEEALAAIDRFIKLHPNHPNVDYLYYLRGLVTFSDKGNILNVLFLQDPTERDPKAARESFDAFKQLVDRFPNSGYAPDATARMKYLVNALAQYEVHVAQYYYRRGAYLAAANRAQAAVNNFRTAPAVEEALFTMVRSYDKLGMVTLRDDAERVFKKNYPESRFLKDGSDGHWWNFFKI